ncbi:MAG: M1 family metallopeptidase [Bacteroidota bacterium]
MRRIIILMITLCVAQMGFGQGDWGAKFEQLGTTLPTPNEYRSASGAPGPSYWQQRADYQIEVELNDKNQSITGSEMITYTNNSPDELRYLWVQLDQNMRASTSATQLTQNTQLRDSLPAKIVEEQLGAVDFDGGYKIKYVTDASGKALPYTINKTMMRVEVPQPLKKGDTFTFGVSWSYNVNARMRDNGRSGYEYFPEDDNYLYTIAQFFPRMAVYDDVNGWQNKQFLGNGEFALPFGDYKVKITVPADHIVASTGVLQNAKQVLSKTQLERFEKSKTTFDKPVIIVTEEEAIKAEKSKSKKTKTWEFHADEVRDFAFASSRKFMWDAQAVKVGDKTPLAMSFYPKEGNPLWEQESTKAVKNTLEVYSKYTIDYPYPVAISVHTASIGMEYPMICFNFGRPDKDGNYSDRVKYRMIGVIIHEVGHNFFPMIINSDERQWTWMDEGLNSFVQYRVEQERYENFPSRRGPARSMVQYMKGDKRFIRPIMTNSEQILQFGNNAYGKPAAALNILREVVMGPELFDYAFKEYARRWAFKHPSPADLFRTMEDASAVDLDWFWKGWFYTTDHVDITVDEVKWLRIKQDDSEPEKTVRTKSGDLKKNDKDKKYQDFSGGYEEIYLRDTDEQFYREHLARVDDKAIRKKFAGKNLYQVRFSNAGGLVMPLLVEFHYKDGTKEIEKIPAEIWRYNEKQAVKIFIKDKEVTKIILDPNQMTADVNMEDNVFPRVEQESRFDKFKSGGK